MSERYDEPKKTGGKQFLRRFFGVVAGILTLGIYPVVKKNLERKRNMGGPVQNMDEIYGDFDPDAETKIEHVEKDEIEKEMGPSVISAIAEPQRTEKSESEEHEKTEEQEME